MSSWVRLWHDMPTDPKFRTIARAAKQPIADVIAVFVFMLADASANANERGRTQANDEDIASAFDMEEGAVASIREAMQGRVLDGEILTGWDARQPKREDNSAARAKAWRDSKKAEKPTERKRTQANAEERPDTDTDAETDIRKEEPIGSSKKKRGSRLSADWVLPKEWADEAIAMGLPSLRVQSEAAKIRDWSINSKNGVKIDWRAAWRNWVREAVERLPANRPQTSTIKDSPANAAERRIEAMINGQRPNQTSDDYQPAPRLVSGY